VRVISGSFSLEFLLELAFLIRGCRLLMLMLALTAYDGCCLLAAEPSLFKVAATAFDAYTLSNDID
jgi:hypothetical protein